MKITKRKIILIISILLIAFPLTTFAHSGRTDSSGGHKDNKNKSGLGQYHYHCGGHPAHLHKNGVCPYSPQNNTNTYTPTDKISITDYNTTMYVGQYQTFSYDIESESSYTKAEISSSNNQVVHVNGTRLTAIGVGTATITVKTETAKKTFTITVKEIFADTLEVLLTQRELQVGESMDINCKILPEDTTNKNIAYTSSDTNIATVSLNGKIKGISPGEVTITATTSNNLSQDITINVFEVYPESIKCEDEIKLVVGDKYSVNINILPENTNNKNYTILSNNQELLIVEKGSYLKALKEGSTSIHIETWNGISKDIPIQIDIIPVENIEIYDDDTEYIYGNIIDKKSKIILNTEIFPADATYKDITWSSSDESIVSIEDNQFIVNGIGKVVLTANTHENISKNIELFIIDIPIVMTLLFISFFTLIIFGIFFFKRRNNIVKNKEKEAVIVKK